MIFSGYAVPPARVNPDLFENNQVIKVSKFNTA